jgi:hypothetical protein
MLGTSGALRIITLGARLRRRSDPRRLHPGSAAIAIGAPLSLYALRAPFCARWPVRALSREGAGMNNPLLATMTATVRLARPLRCRWI